MYIQREISRRLNAAAASTPALVLTGARQTGKTTALRNAFPKHRYVSLDLPSLAEQAELNPAAFLAAHPPPVIIDEVQYAPGLFRHLKIAIDARRHEYGQFILTGSQKFTLMQAVSDSLAGRCIWLELEGFSLVEIAKLRGVEPIAMNQLDALQEMLVRGSFPELWVNDKLSSTDFYSTYLATYLERDVRQLINVSSLRDFERFVRACAARSGQLLDKSSLARDVGVSPKTINAWLSALVASNQLVLLEPYFANTTKKLVKSPKMYMADVGLCAYLLGITHESLPHSPYVGALWETFIFAEMRKALVASAAPYSTWFYRDDRQLEIDFLLLAGGSAKAIEAKWGEQPTSADAKNLRLLAAWAAEKGIKDMTRFEALVVSRTAAPFPLRGDGAVVSAVNLPGLLSTL